MKDHARTGPGRLGADELGSWMESASSTECTGLMMMLPHDYDEWQAFCDLQRLMPGVTRRK